MKNKLLLFIIFTIVLTNCKLNHENKFSERNFIKSYTKLDKRCKESIIDIIKPYEYEDKIYKISDVYDLDVELDTSIYSYSDLLYSYFIGIVFEPDSFELLILHLDFNFGMINYCEIINGKLVINNLNALFCNMKSLGNNNCMNIDTALTYRTRNIKTKFRSVYMPTSIFGTWIPSSKFKTEKFNNKWIFQRKNDIIMTNNHDSLFNDNFILEGGTLKFINTQDSLEILTLTHKSMLIREYGTEEFVLLKKQINN